MAAIDKKVIEFLKEKGENLSEKDLAEAFHNAGLTVEHSPAYKDLFNKQSTLENQLNSWKQLGVDPDKAKEAIAKLQEIENSKKDATQKLAESQTVIDKLNNDIKGLSDKHKSDLENYNNIFNQIINDQTKDWSEEDKSILKDLSITKQLEIVNKLNDKLKNKTPNNPNTPDGKHKNSERQGLTEAQSQTVDYWAAKGYPVDMCIKFAKRELKIMPPLNEIKKEN